MFLSLVGSWFKIFANYVWINPFKFATVWKKVENVLLTELNDHICMCLQKEIYKNPLVKMAEDDFSVDSDSNNGDPPRFKIRGKTM